MRYQHTRMETFRNVKLKPVARCMGCGYYEQVCRIERGEVGVSPDLATIKAA